MRISTVLSKGRLKKPKIEEEQPLQEEEKEEEKEELPQEKNEEQTNQVDTVVKILGDLYVTLMRIERGEYYDVPQTDFIGQFNEQIRKSSESVQDRWGTSDACLRYRLYEFDEKPTEDYGVREAQEWFNGIIDFVTGDRVANSEELRKEDIEWWNGLETGDKWFIFKLDCDIWMKVFKNYKECRETNYNCYTADYVKTHFPTFGYPENPRYSEGDLDRPLPFPLLKRISGYIYKRFYEVDSVKLAREIRGIGNFNIFIPGKN